MAIVLNGYKIGAQIGDGGMATVYKGLQLSLQRPVAIKVLKSKLIDHQEIRKRFERESLIIARLNHPNIIHVIDQGITDDGRPYFVMEYVKSIGLDSAMRKGSMNASRALDVFTQVAKALAYAHKNGVIHCDIKPENILVDFEGFVRVLDFGIAQIYEDVEGASKDGEGYVMGSENYMAPEQHKSITEATEKSDLYALGVIMYAYFTQQLPRDKPLAPSQINRDVSRDIDALILQCLANSPADRPASADVVRNSLLKALQGGHLNKQQKQRASIDVKKTFRLLDVVKEGDHGAVYLFTEEGTNTLFVIKKKPINSPGYATAKHLVDIRHRNIVKVLGTSQNERAFILVMEYCSGGSLAERLVKPYAHERFLGVAQQILSGLVAAQKENIIHGNLRPTNILFDSNGCVKVSDFGLDEHYVESESNWYSTEGSEKLTNPELADVFALGVIFYQMLAGELPRWKNGNLVKAKNFTIQPEGLQTLIRKMLAKAPQKRPKSFDVVSRVLNAQFDAEHTIVRGGTMPDGDLDYDLDGSPEANKNVGRNVRLLLLCSVLAAMSALLYFLNKDLVSDILIHLF
ncbi:MAG: protein kinase [Agarilytica sp.]